MDRRPLNFHARPDWHTRALVDAGLELAERDGIRRGAEFMADHGVPLEVARRVLAMTEAVTPPSAAAAAPKRPT